MPRLVKCAGNAALQVVRRAAPGDVERMEVIACGAVSDEEKLCDRGVITSCAIVIIYCSY